MRPPENLMQLAGKWFKRWDDGTKSFTSNIKDEVYQLLSF